jgi:RHS repeat-associated protein
LYFYRARYYDPKAGRFISKDPIGFAGGDVNLFAYVDSVGKPETNLYAYTSDDPVNWIDPYGLKTKPGKSPNLNKSTITPTPDPNEGLPSNTSNYNCKSCPKEKWKKIYWACVTDNFVNNLGTYAGATALLAIPHPLATIGGYGVYIGQSLIITKKCRNMADQCLYRR